MMDFRGMTDYCRNQYFRPSIWMIRVFQAIGVAGLAVFAWSLVYGATMVFLAGCYLRFLG